MVFSKIRLNLPISSLELTLEWTSSPLDRPRLPSSSRSAIRVISARGAETVRFRKEERITTQTAITAMLTRADSNTVMRIWRLAWVLEIPAKIRPLICPEASLVGT